jgi:hypothetical protein
VLRVGDRVLRRRQQIDRCQCVGFVGGDAYERGLADAVQRGGELCQ